MRIGVRIGELQMIANWCEFANWYGRLRVAGSPPQRAGEKKFEVALPLHTRFTYKEPHVTPGFNLLKRVAKVRAS